LFKEEIMTQSSTAFRVEKDLLGEENIPAHAYWGVHTSRALENYQITGIPISNAPELVQALASVKWAAAKANADLGVIPSHLAQVIVKACEEIREGRLHDQFVVDVIQGGAGTSTNMNANEVIANRAIELLGGTKGDYKLLHPIEHVNASQSTNDVYPTAVKIGLINAISGLLDAMDELRVAFGDKSSEFKEILKIGRTQLQDAVPMTLGQEFAAFSIMIGEDLSRLREATSLIMEINLGATAIGTGINTEPEYAARARHYLAEVTGLNLVTAEDLVEATQDTGAFVQLSGVLKRVACKLSKICNDLRLLSSGPQAGLNEINLPPRAAGSSIMPGKVNPVIPEVMNQVAFEVIGNDITVTMASEAGQLQLNAFEPIMGWSLFKSIYHLTAACRTLTKNCVLGISANEGLLKARVEESACLATSLNPYIGYDKASEIAKTALKTGRKVSDLVLEQGLLSEQQLKEILRPEVLTRPRRIKL
jgi:aspartate ammonia-lyase